MVTLTNGMVSRVFMTSPDWFTMDYTLTATAPGSVSSTFEDFDLSFVRGIAPEAQLFLDNSPLPTNVGGAVGQPRYLIYYSGFALFRDPAAFQFAYYNVSAPVGQWDWSPRRYSDNATWPPAGVHLAVTFLPPPPPANGSAYFTYQGVALGCDLVLGCPTDWVTCNDTIVPGEFNVPRVVCSTDFYLWYACVP